MGEDSLMRCAQAYGWEAHSNIAPSILEKCIYAAEDFIQLQQPAIRYVCHERIKRTAFTYIDPHKKGTTEPELTQPFSIWRLPRTITSEVSDKLKLAKKVEQHGLFNYAPRAYTTLDAAIESKGDPDRLMFIKARGGAGGLQVSCVKHSELSAIGKLKPGYIIQEGVQNPALFLNRKTVLRFYLLVFDGAVYISKHGVVIAHGKDYDPTSTDYKIQIQHNGAGKATIRFPFYKLPQNDVWFEQLKALTRGVLPVLEGMRKRSTLFHYGFIGADGIPCEDGTVKLIEFNMQPALDRPPLVDSVYVPVFSSVMLMTVAGLNDNTWVKIE
jgi:prolyl 4-hydroxylase